MLLNEEERKQKNKKEKQTESLNMTVEMTRRSNYLIMTLNLRKLCINKITAETTKRL